MRVWRGKTIAEKHQEQLDKQRTRKETAPLSAAQKRKIAELQKRLDAMNRAILCAYKPKGVEIR